jgi:hypothetical protein
VQAVANLQILTTVIVATEPPCMLVQISGVRCHLYCFTAHVLTVRWTVITNTGSTCWKCTPMHHCTCHLYTSECECSVFLVLCKSSVTYTLDPELLMHCSSKTQQRRPHQKEVFKWMEQACIIVLQTHSQKTVVTDVAIVNSRSISIHGWAAA